jgi:hypothetical protein
MRESMSGKAYLGADATLRRALGHGGGTWKLVYRVHGHVRYVQKTAKSVITVRARKGERSREVSLTLGLHSGCTWVTSDLQVIASLQPETSWRLMLFAWKNVVGELGHD